MALQSQVTGELFWWRGWCVIKPQKQLTMSIEATHLGKNSNYPQHYDPTVLVAVPRQLNREQYQIKERNLPFTGVDVWNAYEFSFLLKNGLPVVGILKIVYSCASEFLVESKSLKLYLNSFNMDGFGNAVNDGINQTVTIIQHDLEKLLNCTVEVCFFKHNHPVQVSGFEGFTIVEELIDSPNLKCNNYTESQELLDNIHSSGELNWGTHLLRSNCKITFQPDWGSIFVSMKGPKQPTPEGFLKYIISLRNENHFHEEICEMVYKRFTDIYEPEHLMVTCAYTRRGGIDINPVRSRFVADYPLNLINPTIKTAPVFRQ